MPELPPPRLRTRLATEGASPKAGDAIALFGGTHLVCAERHEADVACFGPIRMKGQVDRGVLGLQGDVVTTNTRLTVPVSIRGLRARKIAADGDGRCAIDLDRELLCWGAGHVRGVELPSPVAPSKMSRVLDVSLDVRTCAVTTEQHVVCWGGELCREPGETKSSWTDAHTIPGIDDAIAVGVGTRLICTLSRAGQVKCWGYRDDDGLCRVREPTLVPGLERVVQIAVGTDGACALVEAGDVKCWGQSETALLGVVVNEPLVLDPVTVASVSPAVKLNGHYTQMCALLATGEVWCWGDGLFYDQPAQHIPDLHDAIDIVAAHNFACALRADRSLQCFGRQLDRDRKPGVPFPFEPAEAWVDPPVLTIEPQAP